MAPEPAPTLEQQDGVTVIGLNSDYQNINEALLNALGPQLLELVQQIEPPVAALDMSHVDFFGSAFIEVLFRVSDRLQKKEGGAFAMCGLTQYCKEVLEVTNLDKYWRIYPTRDDAVAALKQ